MDSVRIIVDRVIKYYSKMFLLRRRKGKEKRKIHSSIRTILRNVSLNARVEMSQAHMATLKTNFLDSNIQDYLKH